MTARRRVAILISGRGSNMSALLDACARPGFPAEIVQVLSNRPDAPGLARAAEAGLPTAVVDHRAFADRPAFDGALHAMLARADVDLVCLAGFMRIMTDGFVRQWEGRMLNIHPSLLPLFRGLDTHRRALDAGMRIAGCTVHFVTPELDAGPIIAQAAVPVLPHDTPETLAARVLQAEHRIYPLALELVANGKISLTDNAVKHAGLVSADEHDILLNPQEVR